MKDKTYPTHKSWSLPPLGWLKINFYADVKPPNVYFAAICRDHMDGVTHAWIDHAPYWLKPKLGSLLFLVLSPLVWNIPFFRAMHSMSSPSFRIWLLSPTGIFSIISNIKSITTSFHFCSFTHVIRASNCMTHALVAWAPFCNISKALLFSYLPAHILEVEKADGSRQGRQMDRALNPLLYNIFMTIHQQKNKNRSFNSRQTPLFCNHLFFTFLIPF